MGSTTATDVIQFMCPHCERTNRVPAKYAGRRGKCPKCCKPVRVPEDTADFDEDEDDDYLDDEELDEFMELASSRIDSGDKRQDVFDALLRRGLKKATADEILKTVMHKANREGGQAMIMEGVCALVLGLVLFFYFPVYIALFCGIPIAFAGLVRSGMGGFQLATGTRLK